MKKYIKNTGVACQKINDQETVLLYHKAQKYFRLNIAVYSVWANFIVPVQQKKLLLSC